MYDGRVNLLKDGQVVQVNQTLPDPTNHQNMLMTVGPAGRIFYEKAGSHSASHGFTNRGTADGLIASLDLLSDFAGSVGGAGNDASKTRASLGQKLAPDRTGSRCR